MAHEEIAPGTEIVGFDFQLPVGADICLQQIGASIARGIPDAVERCALTIVANGPTARQVDLRGIETATLALNGSLKLFVDQGLAPTYWAACDPQERLADLLPDNPPEDTLYYVASKCHPAVFEKLKDRQVCLWHLCDHPAPGRVRQALACSVTISASWLMHRLGFTDFEYWGWDGCFVDGQHHAGASDWPDVPVMHMNYGGKIQNGEVLGGRTFATTRSWAAEAKGADQFFQLAEYFDIGIKINGDGMFNSSRQAILGIAA